jgi:transcriptional antiterminator NusG
MVAMVFSDHEEEALNPEETPEIEEITTDLPETDPTILDSEIAKGEREEPEAGEPSSQSPEAETIDTTVDSPVEEQEESEGMEAIEPAIAEVEIIDGPLEATEEEIESVEAAEPTPDEAETIDQDLEISEEEKGEAEEVEDDGRAWYVVHCYSGYENKVRHNLEQRIETMNMKGKIFDIVVPTEEEIEVREGKRRTVERRVFPGYILVNMIMTEESWYVVRNTPGVTGFVGMGNTPTALRPEEVSQIIKRMEAEAPRIKVTFKPGERVHIVDGPFNDFRGTVAEIDMERAKVRVMVNFFGRETPVELDFLQVEKI